MIPVILFIGYIQMSYTASSSSIKSDLYVNWIGVSSGILHWIEMPSLFRSDVFEKCS